MAEPLEWLIAEAVMRRLDTPALPRLFAAVPPNVPQDAQAELASEQAQLDDLADLYASWTITEAGWLRARKQGEERRDAARRRLRALTR